MPAGPPFDVDSLRADSRPRREQDGRPVGSLDGPRGTQVPQRVTGATSCTGSTQRGGCRVVMSMELHLSLGCNRSCAEPVAAAAPRLAGPHAAARPRLREPVAGCIIGRAGVLSGPSGDHPDDLPSTCQPSWRAADPDRARPRRLRWRHVVIGAIHLGRDERRLGRDERRLGPGRRIGPGRRCPVLRHRTARTWP